MPSLIHRPSSSRGHADHGWLKSYHTFHFADYYDSNPLAKGWGPLKVINEDRVAPGRGFPPHPHREFEIFSYIVDGTIVHGDNMKNQERLGRGEIQMSSAGTGLVHGEGNGGSDGEELYFLQIWARPHTRGLKPSYSTRPYTDEEKRGNLVRVVADVTCPAVTETREGTGPTPIHSHVEVFASILPPSDTVTYAFRQPKGYLHLTMRKTGYRGPHQQIKGNGPRLSVKIGEEKAVELEEGDGLYFDQVEGQTTVINSIGDGDAEFVLFDLADE